MSKPKYNKPIKNEQRAGFNTLTNLDWFKDPNLQERALNQQTEILLKLQANVLESIAKGKDLIICLNHLCILIEKIIPNSLCSIMLLDRFKNMLNVISAPSVDQNFIDILNGTVPGELNGSCGNAAYSKETVIVTDTLTDPRWDKLRDVAKKFEIKACWSIPIFSKTEEILGTFAISHTTSCTPTTFTIQIMKIASHLASIAIDRKNLEDVLIQSQKMESIGVLASGVAHDFNNILVGIMGNADIALNTSNESSDIKELLESILESSHHAAALASNLMIYAGKGRSTKEILNLNLLVTEMLNLVKVSSNINFELYLLDHLWIEGDATHIRQVIMNLMTNAADASMMKETSVMIRTGTIKADKEFLQTCINGKELIEGNYAFFEIEDQGSGIEPDNIIRIFDPFFSTKSFGRGLGLSITMGIIKSHNGGLHVTSKPNSSTIFRFLCPQLDNKGDIKSGFTLKKNKNDFIKKTLLVVDNNITVLEVISVMLGVKGYKIITATSGKKALEILEKTSCIDAVILDMNMPNISGREVYQEIREMNDELPVLICTGNISDQFSDLKTNSQITGHIIKPFTGEEISNALKMLMQIEEI
ncbi:MAG: signal transduction histidine kinase/ActR/RegA family two-component response regulator [Gammaproteobacteria bacterium]|jgi:signal transduction histidine kinase/ActR/RegA family two-component response regulator